MDTKRIGLCIVLILCTGCSRIYAATVAATFDPQPVVLGQNTTIRCRYSLQPSDERFLSMEMVYLSGSTEAIMTYLYPAENNFAIQWATTADQSIVNRADLDTVRADNSLVVRFNDGAKCTDQSMRFECVVRFFASVDVTRDQVDLIVQAPPQAPTLVMSPDSDNVTEYSEVTFTCSGNVGLPAGSFQWFTFNGIDDQNMLDVTSSATETQSTPAPSPRDCTTLKTSELKLNVTRRDPSKKLVVRCRIQHDQQGNSNPNDCSNPDTDFCRMSKQIDVQYPVSVTLESEKQAQEGGELTVTCNTEGNPQADESQIQWVREGDNSTTYPNGNTLRITGVTMEHAGNYTCTAYNTVEGILRSDSKTVVITVVETTTPLPTTPTTSTTPGAGGGGTTEAQSSKAGSDNLEIIIPVVLVVVLIVVIAIIVFIVVRRRGNRKQVEEPPEKPFNNHSGLNTIATRPDLVTGDKSFNTSYDTTNGYKTNEDGLAYAELQFDNKPRSRRPLAIDDSHTDYSDVSMPQV